MEVALSCQYDGIPDLVHEMMGSILAQQLLCSQSLKYDMITLVNRVCIATCRLDVQVELTCHLEDVVVFSNILQKVLGVRVVFIIQLPERFRGRRKLLQSKLSIRTADRWRFTRKSYCAASSNMSHLTQAHFCLK